MEYNMGCKEFICHERAYQHSDWFLSLQGMVTLRRESPKRPWITKVELTKIAIGVAEPTRVSTTKQCHLMANGAWKVYGVNQKKEVRCSLHRYMMNITACCWNVIGSSHLQIYQQDIKQKCWHRCQIWLDCEQQSQIANLGLFWGESDHEFNTTVEENILSFPVIFYTASDDQRFGSYDFWKCTGLLKFCSRQNWASW
jgi:hypothetical protein